MRVVRNVLIFLLSIILIPRDGLLEGAHDEDHEDGDHGISHDDPFSSVSRLLIEAELRELEHGEEEAHHITYTRTTEIARILLQRFDCPERKEMQGYCDQCAVNITQHIFTTLDVNAMGPGLSENDFSNASMILFYLFSLENLEATCGGYTMSLDTYSNMILGMDGSLSEDELEEIINEMSHNYHPESKSKCFNVETIFEAEVADHEAGATREELLHVAPLVISYLLQGYCVGEPTQTDPQEFLENIFHKYSTDGKIPEDEFEKILEALSIGGIVEDDHGHGHEDEHGHEEEHEDEEEHGHAKRSLKSRDAVVMKREVADEHGHEHESANGSMVMDVEHTCFSGEEILNIHGVEHDIGITEEQFVQICPSLIQQILSESCTQPHDEGEKETDGLVWLYGTIAVFIISLGAILGGIFLPCLPINFYEKFIHGLIALAIAVLAGDALIHLLPLATGIHGHEAGSHAVHSPLDEELSFAWKSLACLLAIYVFYLLETIMGWWSGHEHTHPGDMVMTSTGNGKMSESQKELTAHADGIYSGTESGGCLSRFGPLPVMVIIGDGLHNFGDGLAIGAAFTAGIGPGISTSIAVLCHEIPHELGDLAILLKSGLKLRWALFLNFMSALTAFAGLYLGIILATTEVARQWIFAVTAGMFLYVALADMMPQITRLANVKNPVITFIVQNIFFLIGTVFIFLIAIYEDAINVSF